MTNLRPLALCIALLSIGRGVSAQNAPVNAPLSEARIFAADASLVRKMANGAEFRSIVHGELKTGESVDLHETMQPVGTVPSPLHAIQHSEFIVVREGMIVFVHEGKVERVGPGGVMYVALGTIHSLKNVGDVPARYVVIAIGGDVKK
ncbi:Cupin 2 conserved barrel domain protein [Terriglobus saanensis SP1PR4]|uniref:Cupin 2 conserved barrel domain protein n=2 Tax=Terriglobus saanensis TaxID=870903 RepID=E8V6F3_TERSS|nr:Cupin 2 conserved barrel domain protein [Terriglobus saanensis SP1PR4]